MANIIVNSQFNPFTYLELLAPVLAATTEHKALEAELGALLTQASVWEKLANNENDKNAYNQYKTYIDDLNSKVNTLSELGLTPGARQGLYNAAQRYAKEIVPIAQADELRQKDIAAQLDIRLKDSSYIFDKTAADTGLDYYLKNGNLKYNGLSVNEVYGTVAKDFQLAASKLMREGKWNTVLGGQYWEKLDQTGYTLKEIEAALKGDENAPEELKQLYSSTLESYLSRGEWDESGQLAIKEAIDRGAFYGIGTLKSEYRENQNYLNPLQRKQLEGLNKPIKPEKPESRYKDSALLTFPQTKEKIKGLVDENGSLLPVKGHDKSMINNLFLNGKFTNPGMTEEDHQEIEGEISSNPFTAFDEGMYESLIPVAQTKYEEIHTVLSDLGYTDDEISNMSRSDVEGILTKVLEGSQMDAVGTQTYRFPLDEESSKYFKGKINQRSGGEVYKIEGLQQGQYKLGEKMKLPEGGTIDIHYDHTRRSWIAQGEEGYFKVPIDMLSLQDQEEMNRLYQQEYFNEVKLSLLEKISQLRDLTPYELVELKLIYNFIDGKDDVILSIGERLVSHLGKKKEN